MTEIQGKSILVRVSDRFDLGTGHYLSPGGRGTEDFRGDHLIFRRTEGGISLNLEPKRGGSLKTLEGFTDAPLKFAWKMKTWRGGGDCESHQQLSGGITLVK